MGDRAIVIVYTKDPFPQKLLEDIEGTSYTRGDVCSALAQSGLVSFATKGHYPEFVLGFLCALDTPAPEGTVALSINDSGEERRYVFEKGMWIAQILADCRMVPEDLYKAWLGQAATLTQKDEEIRRLKYEISVLKGKLP